MSVAIATLLIAYGMCFACLSGQLRAEFPKAFDNIGAGLLGFLTGFLVCSFVGFAVALTPLTQIASIKPLGLDAASQQTNTSYLCWWCNKLHSFVLAQGSTLKTSQDATQWLLAKVGAPAGGGPRRGALPPPGETGSPPQPGPMGPAKHDGEVPGARGRPEGGGGQDAETVGPKAGGPRRPERRPNRATDEEPSGPPRGGEKSPSAAPGRVIDPFAPEATKPRGEEKKSPPAAPGRVVDPFAPTP